MRYKFTKDEYAEIENLVQTAISMPNKQQAKKFTDRLCFMRSDVCGYAGNLFSELIATTLSASGAVRDKTRQVEIVQQSLYKLKSFGVENES
jgi:hypothetical protein